MSEQETNYAITLPEGDSNFLRKYMGKTGIMITNGIWFDEGE